METIGYVLVGWGVLSIVLVAIWNLCRYAVRARSPLARVQARPGGIAASVDNAATGSTQTIAARTAGVRTAGYEQPTGPHRR